ncbi:MAG TPA: hypothetical protein VG733_19065 [Chthoniobacteraceae bacterium]|nr:hypothetical protein [Chthoniobacteraceae bacterium]
MAEPIPLEIPARDPVRELQARLQNAPVEHAEALLAGYDLLQSLHDSGSLDILRGIVGQKDALIGQLAATANTPEFIRGLRNMVVLAEALGKIDPGAMEAVTDSWTQALAKIREDVCDPPGLWKILRQFRGKDLRRGLLLVNTLLEKFGSNLCHERSNSHEPEHN